MALLEVEHLHKRFGGNVVLAGVSLDVAAGQVHGVIGPNGAGKTTLFNIINGVETADAGRIRLAGRRLLGRPVNKVAAAGVGRTFQVPRVFDELTVMENMLVPVVPARMGRAKAEAQAQRLLEMAQLLAQAETPAVALSGGQKKLLEFARTMMRDPRVVLLDEPFNGISPALIEVLIEMIKRLNREGRTFLLISHEMPHVMELCSIVTVLAGGGNVAQGAPDAVRADPAVIEAYLGTA